MLKYFRTGEQRYQARMARNARWTRPIRGRVDRAAAWLNMLAVDHGVFRLLYLNEHRVGPKLIRAAQPSPRDIERWARAGVRTVIYLRGGREHGSWPLEREACQRHGLILEDFVVRSRGAPDRQAILDSAAFFDRLAYPAVVHCKSGADRAGFMAALFLIVHEGRPVREALRQLSLRFGHFRFAKTGILDRFFELYAEEGEARGVAFLDWVRERYDPAALEDAFRARFASDLLVDRLLGRE